MAKKKRPVPTGHVFEDIRAFQQHFGFDQVDVKYQFLVNQVEFLKEELDETIDALKRRDAKEFLDGIVDLIVVAAGTLAFSTEHRDAPWIEVMSKNLKKELGFNPKRPNSNGADLIKPDGWTAPDHSPFVDRLNEIFGMTPDHEVRKYFPPELPMRESVNVLYQAAEVLRRKSADYVNPNSSVSAADYYPNGSDDFVYMIDTLKRLRQNSLLDAARNSKNGMASPIHESLEDTLLDRINYLALWIEWLRGKTPGQDLTKDQFNRRIEDDQK